MMNGGALVVDAPHFLLRFLEADAAQDDSLLVDALLETLNELLGDTGNEVCLGVNKVCCRGC